MSDYSLILKQTSPFFRFLLVGVVNTIVGLSSIFILLNVFMLNYWPSTFVGNTIGATVSFFLNRRFTFNSSVSIHKGAPAFIMVIIICYFGSYSISQWCASQFDESFFTHTLLTKQNLAVLFGTCLYTVSNYLGQKYVVFYHGKKS